MVNFNRKTRPSFKERMALRVPRGGRGDVLMAELLSKKRSRYGVAEMLMERVSSHVSSYYGFGSIVNRPKSRLRRAVIMRHMFYYFVYEYFGSTISKKRMSAFVGQEHTASLHGIKSIRRLVEVGDKATLADIRLIDSTLRGDRFISRALDYLRV